MRPPKSECGSLDRLQAKAPGPAGIPAGFYASAFGYNISGAIWLRRLFSSSRMYLLGARQSWTFDEHEDLPRRMSLEGASR